MAAKRRYREGAVILPLGGLLLFMPPYLLVFDRPDFIAGIPLLHLYIFGCWFVGIVLTAFVARGLVRDLPAAKTSDDDAPQPDRLSG